jgi:hypothetical protein
VKYKRIYVVKNTKAMEKKISTFFNVVLFAYEKWA